jgi:hypothetical protein
LSGINKKARLLQRAVDDPDRSRHLKFIMSGLFVKQFFTDIVDSVDLLIAKFTKQRFIGFDVLQRKLKKQGRLY